MGLTKQVNWGRLIQFVIRRTELGTQLVKDTHRHEECKVEKSSNLKMVARLLT